MIKIEENCQFTLGLHKYVAGIKNDLASSTNDWLYINKFMKWPVHTV